MNPIAEEMRAILEEGTDDELKHYGMPRRSGRYPWGSGDEPYQRTRDFLSRVEELKKNNFTYTDEDGKTWTGEKAIYKSMGLTSGQYRQEISICKDQRLISNIATATRLRDKEGLGPTAIGRKMGVNESTVRGWLEPDADASYRATKATVNFLRDQVDKKGMVDVGTGVDKELNISDTRLATALYYLKTREGYEVYSGRMDQTTNPMQKTTQKVLCVPGTQHKDIYQLDKVHSLKDYVSHDGGETFDTFVYPASMSSKRLKVRYSDEVGPDGATGEQKDGIVELRRGVADLSLGESKYSQVRILVDGTHYIKGMAVYSDDMPPGVDIVFNTNKKTGTPALGPKDSTVLKPIKSDPDNPFGSAIKPGGQSYFTDKNGKRQLSLINKRSDEGDWSEWADALPSQFLSKQSLDLAKKQLTIAKADKQAEFDEIRSLTNPTVKKYWLEKFASDCDSAAVHLKAAALPGQKYHVIIPVNTLKDNEVYAPRYESGTKLALIRYPHGGTFEIPILTVNNKNPLANKIIGKSSIDAVGINKNNADRLSGADFDGDTVMCIPTHDSRGRVKITSTKELEGLKGFDPKLAYGPETYKGRTIKFMTRTDTEMGKISNLITDMTLLGAGPDKLARAVRHSMVVIDAEKHKLDYKKSEMDNDIAALRREFQPKYDDNGVMVRAGGASTIISRAKGERDVIRRKGNPRYNQPGKEYYDPNKPEGALIWQTDPDAAYTVTKTNRRTGEVKTSTHYRMQKSTQMAETDDAYSLVSATRHPMEIIYADYANSMKAMANAARKELMGTGKIAYDSTAKATYQAEVDSLNEKLRKAQMNSPRERAALRMANVEVASKQAADPDMKKSDIKKAGQQAITKYRQTVSAVTRKDRNINITDREWEAIQAGAISENILRNILKNADPKILRQKSMPKTNGVELPTYKQSTIKAMSASYTIQQIADKLNLSPTTVAKYLKGKE